MTASFSFECDKKVWAIGFIFGVEDDAVGGIQLFLAHSILQLT